LFEFSDNKDNNWLKVDIIESIQSIGHYDKRLIAKVEECLKHLRSKVVNSRGLRQAAFETLKTFNVEVKGRSILEIVWQDKFNRGRSKFFRAAILSIIAAVILFAILFFLLLFPEIVAINRSIPTQCTITDLFWTLLWPACGTSLCYEGTISVSSSFSKI
jgi:hypothetical protein